MPDTISLVTKTLSKTKIVEADNKVLVFSDLLKKTYYDPKIKDIKKKYFTSTIYNKFTSETLDAKIKQKESVNKSDISDLKK